jgi:hypothetical protein
MGQHAIRNTIAVYVNISVFSNVNKELLDLYCQCNKNKITESSFSEYGK